MPSLRRRGECDRNPGLPVRMRLGIARCSKLSNQSFCGDVGIDPLLVLEGEKRETWFPVLVNGV